MSLEIDIPGFQKFVTPIDFGSIVTLDGAATDTVKSVIAWEIGYAAAENGMGVIFVTSRNAGYITKKNTPPGAMSSLFFVTSDTGLFKKPDTVKKNSLVILDSFSCLFCEATTGEIKAYIGKLKEMAMKEQLIVILVNDRDIFEQKANAIVYHLSDAVVQFGVRESPEGINRFMRIPLWTNGNIVDDYIYYNVVGGKKINVDARRRIV